MILDLDFCDFEPVVEQTVSLRICPVKVGDIFYHRKPNMTIPDRLQVLEIKDVNGTFYIRAKYLYHAIGPFERTFSDVIFKDPDWVIER